MSNTRKVKRKENNDIYYCCEECRETNGAIRGAYEGAPCPVHGKPLHKVGTFQELERSYLM